MRPIPLLSLVMIAGISSAATAADCFPPNPEEKEYERLFYEAGDAEGELTTAVELKALVRKGPKGEPLTSIDDLVSALPVAHRKYFTLGFASGSSQEATAETPRVISYGATGQLLMAFNGHGNGSDRLELIELPPGKPARFFEVVQVGEGRERRLEMSEANPKRCLGCHGDPPRPIFETYPNWPGFFGGSDDSIRKDSKEDKAFRAFLAKTPKPPRYAALLGFDRVKFDKSKGDYTGDREFKDPNTYALPWFPNTALSYRIGKHAACELYRTLTAHPAASRYRAFLMADTLRCGKDEDVLPAGDAAAVAKKIEAYEKEMLEAEKKRQQKVLEALAAGAGVPVDKVRSEARSIPRVVREGARLRFVVEDIAGLKLGSYTIPAGRDASALITVGDGLGRDLSGGFVRELEQRDPEFKKMNFDQRCKYLKDLVAKERAAPPAPAPKEGGGKGRTH